VWDEPEDGVWWCGKPRNKDERLNREAVIRAATHKKEDKKKMKKNGSRNKERDQTEFDRDDKDENCGGGDATKAIVQSQGSDMFD
jgi:hypothetical protein